MKSMPIVGVLTLSVLMLAAGCSGNKQTPDAGTWRESFTVDKTNLSSTGSNPYFILQPGYRLHFANGDATLTITVLNETKVVDGVETRVIEEREEKSGKPAEISRNYFAINKATKDVYYFGEDVDIYKDRKVTSHEGAWLSGVNGAKFGLFMPGSPKVGDRFYQELAPKVAMDRVEIASVSEKVQTPAGKFDNCLKTNETSALESGTEHKFYAPGVGLIRDGEFVLDRIEKP